MTRGLHWFRNDLRLHDNTALAALLERVDTWLPVFVLDGRIQGSQHSGAARLTFMLDCLGRVEAELEKRGVPLIVRTGRPEEVLPQLMHETGARLLSFNEDTTPFAAARDREVRRRVEKDDGEIVSRVDHVVFTADEIRTGSGGAFSVYTPYRNAWWKHWRESPRRPIRMPRFRPPIEGFEAEPAPTAADLDLDAGARDLPTGGEAAAKRRLDRFLGEAVGRYDEDRDRPAVDGTSRLSPYLRFGALSVRECFDRGAEAAAAEPSLREGVEKWLDELIWRDFYAAILETHPRVLNENHRTEYDAMVWNDDAEGFEAWCEGRTGFPIVDAGMRQLRETGWMHNRVRMIVASFLTKDLLIHWKQGERFFFDQLVDGDPASNNGGWQWAASTGTDAQPYFRIYNPTKQGERWDPDGRYVRRWVPELEALPDGQVHTPWKTPLLCDYPAPIVDHAERRALALERFKAARAQGSDT
jgi:deoxyribodipyrimidine photo-lyase